MNKVILKGDQIVQFTGGFPQRHAGEITLDLPPGTYRLGYRMIVNENVHSGLNHWSREEGPGVWDGSHLSIPDGIIFVSGQILHGTMIPDVGYLDTLNLQYPMPKPTFAIYYYLTPEGLFLDF